MVRDILKIDEDKCDGCGLCVPNCHEGAIQVIDGKLRMVSELMCDGLGACIGHCPTDAITIEKREAAPYDEVLVMKEMTPKGKNVVIAHLKHLKEHNEHEYLKQGVNYMLENKAKIAFNVDEVIHAVHNSGVAHEHKEEKLACGCPGSAAQAFKPLSVAENVGSLISQLGHWPVQLHLVNPNASYYQSADVVIAADCVAYALGNFHDKFLKGKSLAIACPKLDSNMDVYVAKMSAMIDSAKINTLTVMIMEVPCCGGLLRMVQDAIAAAKRKVPVKLLVVGVKGEILKEEWV